mgnify:CR=1 FL=1
MNLPPFLPGCLWFIFSVALMYIFLFFLQSENIKQITETRHLWHMSSVKMMIMYIFKIYWCLSVSLINSWPIMNIYNPINYGYSKFLMIKNPEGISVNSKSQTWSWQSTLEGEIFSPYCLLFVQVHLLTELLRCQISWVIYRWMELLRCGVWKGAGIHTQFNVRWTILEVIGLVIKKLSIFEKTKSNIIASSSVLSTIL